MLFVIILSSSDYKKNHKVDLNFMIGPCHPTSSIQISPTQLTCTHLLTPSSVVTLLSLITDLELVISSSTPLYTVSWICTDTTIAPLVATIILAECTVSTKSLHLKVNSSSSFMIVQKQTVFLQLG